MIDAAKLNAVFDCSWETADVSGPWAKKKKVYKRRLKITISASCAGIIFEISNCLRN